jgi:hypothetical protein
MKPLCLTEADRVRRAAGMMCRFKSHPMPWRYLCILPSLSRPNLFSGD